MHARLSETSRLSQGWLNLTKLDVRILPGRPQRNALQHGRPR
jgi:hypothetical protein